MLPDRGGGPKPTWHGSQVPTVILSASPAFIATLSTPGLRFAVPPQDRGARPGHPGGLGNPDPHNRRPFEDVAVGPAEQPAPRQVALEEGSWLQVNEDPMQHRTLQQLAAHPIGDGPMQAASRSIGEGEQAGTATLR